jgi:basic membrane protein A
VLAYDAWAHEPSYLAGLLAVGLTKTGKVGVYAAVEIPTIVYCAEAFKLGVKDMTKELNETVAIYEIYTGTFEDVAKGFEAVETFASYGVDIVYGTGDGINVGGIEAARAHGIYFIGGCRGSTWHRPSNSYR